MNAETIIKKLKEWNAGPDTVFQLATGGCIYCELSYANKCYCFTQVSQAGNKRGITEQEALTQIRKAIYQQEQLKLNDNLIKLIQEKEERK